MLIVQEKTKLQEKKDQIEENRKFDQETRAHAGEEELEMSFPTTFHASTRNCSREAPWRRWNPFHTGLLAGMSFYTTFYGTKTRARTKHAESRVARHSSVPHDILRSELINTTFSLRFWESRQPLFIHVAQPKLFNDVSTERNRRHDIQPSSIHWRSHEAESRRRDSILIAIEFHWL